MGTKGCIYLYMYGPNRGTLIEQFNSFKKEVEIYLRIKSGTFYF